MRFLSFSMCLGTSGFAPSTTFHTYKLPPDQLTDLKLAKSHRKIYIAFNGTFSSTSESGLCFG